MTVILGLDPGSLHLGFGVIEARGNRLLHRAHGTLHAPRSQALPRRLALLHEQLCTVLEEHRPIAVAIEKVYTARNPASALTLGHARGMILLAVGQRELELAEYAPSAVKLAVGGHGHSRKAQLAFMVERLLGVDLADAGPDSSDALAVAICHAHHRGQQRLLSRRAQAVSGRTSTED